MTGSAGKLGVGLRDAGFNESFAREVALVGATLPEPLRLPLVRQWLSSRGDTPSLLTLVLSYGASASRRWLRESVGELADALVASRLLVEGADDEVVSPFRTLLVDGLVIVADRPEAGPEAVMPPGPTTEDILRLLPERMVGVVLDVGTGPGTLALSAARRGATVVATDVSRRAARFTSFNAALNDLCLDVRTGHLLEPVAGDLFDLVLAQPPYVPLPPNVEPVTFMHGGARGDELALTLLAAIPEILSPNGQALVRFDMSEDDGHLQRIEQVMGPELDIAVFSAPGGSAESLAAAYGALADPGLGPAYAELAARYLQHLGAAGIAHPRRIVVIARRTEGVVRWRAELPLRQLPGRADDLMPYLASLDLSIAPDDDVVAARLRPAPGSRVVVERHLDGASTAWEWSVRTDSSAPAVDSTVTEVGAQLFQCLAYEHDVRAAIDRLRETYDLDEDVVVDAIRHALARGLLVVLS